MDCYDPIIGPYVIKELKESYRDHPYSLIKIQGNNFFTYAFKYNWYATLCQYTSKTDTLDDLKLITFISEKFLDTQCNYTTLVREGFAIYVSIK